MTLVYVSAGKPVNFLESSFWRILIIDGGGGSTGASEVRFKKNGNNKNNGTPGASGGTPANAFDDDTGTNWTISGEFGEYVSMEFSGSVEIDQVDIVSLFNDNSNTLIDYEVQFSDDGIAWTTMWSSVGNFPPTSNGQATTSDRPFAPTVGAGIVHQRLFAVMGASPEAMINSQRIYAIMGASPEAMVNNIRAYAIYDAGS